MKINQWTADKDVNMKGFFTVMNTRIKSSGVVFCPAPAVNHLRFWNLTPSYLGFEPPSASFKLTVEPFLNLHVHTSTFSQDSSDEEIATLSTMNSSRRPLLANCAILDILLLCRCLFRSCTWSSQSGTAIYFATAACQGCSKFTFTGRWEVGGGTGEVR